MKKEKKFTKLNTLQWAVYRFLENIMLNEGNRTTTIKEIVEHFPDDYELKITEGNHSNCPNLYADLKAITMTSEVDMIVTLNHNKIRLGTELDVLRRLWSLISRSREEEKEIRVIKAKIKNNGQMKLLSNAGVPLDEASPNTKAWHVAFSDENISLTIKQLEQEERARKKVEKHDKEISESNESQQLPPTGETN